MAASKDSVRLQRVAKSENTVQVMYPYKAQHNDELTIQPGKLLLLFLIG
jgi:hypothetical protein